MRQLLAIALVCGLATTAWADPIIWDNGLPNAAESNYSHMPDMSVADDFVLDAGATIVTDIHWWGRPVTPDSGFQVAVYADAGGEPTGAGWGDPRTTALKTWDIPYQDLTETLYDPTNDVYSFDVDVSADPFAAAPGETYWISIYTIGSGSSWAWSKSISQTGYLAQWGSPDYLWAPYWDQFACDCAFNLTGVPEPTTLALLTVGLLAMRRR